MPRLEELINDKVKSKLKTMINTSDDIVKGTVVSDFVGQTPNLNSSLGVNAFYSEYDEKTGEWLDPDPNFDVNGNPITTPSKLDTFLAKNSNILSSGIDIFGGLFGSKPAASTPIYGGVPAEKSGMPWWAWVLIAVVVALIIYFIVKLIKK